MNRKNFHTLLASSSVKQPKYFIVHTPQTPLSLVSCWFKAGSCFDPKDKNGLAHMVEHLYMPKAYQHSDTRQRPEYFEDNGMLYSAFTGKEWTYYYLYQAPEDTNKALEMLLDRLKIFNPGEGDIEAEKQVILDEINRWFNSTSSYIHTLANKGVWPKLQLGKKTLGTADSIASITKKDIYTFWSKHYERINPQILILTPETKFAASLVDKIASLQNRSNSSNLKFAQTVSKPLPTITNYRDSQHLQIATSFLLRNVDIRDTVIIDFISYFLANGRNSKLVQRLRFKLHSTYWVEGYSMYFDKAGCLRFMFSTNKKLMVRSLNAVFDEIERLKSDNISSTNLELYKKAMKTRVLKKYLQPGSIMKFYGQRFIASFEAQVLLQEYLQAIDAISTSSIQKAATKHLTKDKLSIAIIGSISDNEVLKITQSYQWKD